MRLLDVFNSAGGSYAKDTTTLIAHMKPDLEKHEFLKFRLRQRGTSMAQIARELEITQGSVTVVSQGYRRSRRIEAALAEALGVTAQELFPDRNFRRKK